MTSSFFSGRKVLVTGGGGFVGSHLVEALLKLGALVRIAGRSAPDANLKSYLSHIEIIQGDLCNPEKARAAMNGMDVVFNLAAQVSGINFNTYHHAAMFMANTRLSSSCLEAARLEKVQTYVCLSSTCVYSRHATIPTPEEEGFIDDPDPTVMGYGWAKRVSELQASLYSREYGMQIAIPRAMNTYGPRDKFHLKDAHVIPSLVKRVLDNDNELIVWGSGEQTRSFIYVKDLVQGLMAVAERYAKAEPINIGVEDEVTIGHLAKLIVQLCNKDLEIIFDTTKPEGQLRKVADATKAIKELDWQPSYSLEQGLSETIEWYRQKLGI